MSVFAIYNDSDADSTLIPNRFIDEYMADANDAQLKIYLYLVRMMSAGRHTSIADMAERFNHTERDILRSLRYWEQKGLLTLQFDENGSPRSIHVCTCGSGSAIRRPEDTAARTGALPADAADADPGNRLSWSDRTAAVHGDTTVKTSVSARNAGAASVNANAASADRPEEKPSDTEKQELLFVVEQYIGKPLSASEMKTVYYISDQLHFSFEMIDYLVQYCVERGKRDFRYIEQVAINWKEEGVSSVQDARRAAGKGARRKVRAAKKTADGSSFALERAYDASIEQLILDN